MYFLSEINVRCTFIFKNHQNILFAEPEYQTSWNIFECETDKKQARDSVKIQHSQDRVDFKNNPTRK